MKKNVSIGYLIGAVVLAVVLTFNITYVIVWHAFSGRINNLAARELTYSKLAEISTYMDKFYIGRYDEKKLLESTSGGYVKALEDLSSYYLTKEEVYSRRMGADHGYTSIGILSCYDAENGGIRILRMLEGSPALQQGLAVLDSIVTIDGVPVASIGYEAALEKLRGEEGTEVAVTVLREATGERFHVVLRRGAVVTDAFVDSRLLDGRIGYIQIPNFSEGITEAFTAALHSLQAQGMEKLVIDLRFNPGGYMDEMCAVAEQFLSEGQTIYQERDHSGAVEAYRAHGTAEDLPIAVLMDSYTAGGAEFFAAALKENGRAVLVGSKTAGMGYAQSSIELSDGSELVLSTSEYLTAGGKSLHGVGLAPDIEAQADIARLYAVLTQEDAADEQLEEAIKALDS
ncbi:MAG: PDZ domain-containing protein [Oscillospiraceae bacterium]|nr:PDZ domain-containing protein [Oscillospiraceae bacterium]